APNVSAGCASTRPASAMPVASSRRRAVSSRSATRRYTLVMAPLLLPTNDGIGFGTMPPAHQRRCEHFDCEDEHRNREPGPIGHDDHGKDGESHRDGCAQAFELPDLPPSTLHDAP